MRELIQQKLEEIQNIETTPIMTDDIIEEGKTYFSFYILETYMNNDMDKNCTYRVSLTGFLKRKELPDENTIKIIDNAKEEIKQKLKDLNMMISFSDLETVDNIRKARGNANVIYNEITNRLGG